MLFRDVFHRHAFVGEDLQMVADQMLAFALWTVDYTSSKVVCLLGNRMP